MDATDLFDHYEEDYEDVPAGGFPHVEINKMHISQSIEASTELVYESSTLIFSDNLCWVSPLKLIANP